jgi:hypothetical protein
VEGRASRIFAVVDNAGVVRARLERKCRRGEPCDGGWEDTGYVDISGVGVAFDIADVDNDGRPELIASANGVPGEADAVTVRTLDSSATAADPNVFRKGFNGGVAGVAAGDVDADGDVDVIAAVRLLGSHRVDLWLLD